MEREIVKHLCGQFPSKGPVSVEVVLMPPNCPQAAAASLRTRCSPSGWGPAATGLNIPPEGLFTIWPALHPLKQTLSLPALPTGVVQLGAVNWSRGDGDLYLTWPKYTYQKGGTDNEGRGEQKAEGAWGPNSGGDFSVGSWEWGVKRETSFGTANGKREILV